MAKLIAERDWKLFVYQQHLPHHQQNQWYKSLCIQVYSWQYLFVFRFTADSTSLYSDLQLTISNTATNATTVTTTTIITFLFTTANTFKGELNNYSNSDFYQDIRNILFHRFFRWLFWVQKNSGVVKFRYQSVHKSFYTWINTLWNQIT